VIGSWRLSYWRAVAVRRRRAAASGGVRRRPAGLVEAAGGAVGQLGDDGFFETSWLEVSRNLAGWRQSGLLVSVKMGCEAVSRWRAFSFRKGG
jgi:hypothetical protein